MLVEALLHHKNRQDTPWSEDKLLTPVWIEERLRVKLERLADEIATAAGLVMGQANEGVPMVLVRGLSWSAPDAPAADLVRPAEHDLFR